MAKLHTRSVSSLSELIDKLNKEIVKKSQLGQYERKLAAGKVGGKSKKLAFVDSGRIEPAMPFPKTKGVLPLPVFGTRVRGYGDKDKFGARSKGIVIQTRGEAQVTAPADGWVVYSGRFRGYGNLLIINAGGGYHILLAGMEEMNVSLGQFLLAGEPIAAMPVEKAVAQKRGLSKQASLRKSVLAKLAGIGRHETVGKTGPSLYIEFRKKGRPINPAPWWSTSNRKIAKGKV